MISIYAVSDLHTDHTANSEWIDGLEIDGLFSIIIVAGDVTDNEGLLMETFLKLKEKFDIVLFTPGNHDCWVNNKISPNQNSFQRHVNIRRKLEKELGVFVSPISITFTKKHDHRTECLDLHAASDDIRAGCDTQRAGSDNIRAGYDNQCVGSEIIRAGSDSHSAYTSILFVPLLAWHHESFDHESDIPNEEIGGKSFPPIKSVVSDRTRCQWPIAEFLEFKNSQGETRFSCSEQYRNLLSKFKIKSGHSEDWENELIAWRLDQLNQEVGDEFCHKFARSFGQVEIKDQRSLVNDIYEHKNPPLVFDYIISFSHFVPFPFLNPEKRFLFYPPLAKVIGSEPLGHRVIALQPDLHIFGHTHFGWNATLRELLAGQENECVDDVDAKLLGARFLQAPLGYPRERTIRLRSLSVGEFNKSTKSRDLCRVLKIFQPGGKLEIDAGSAYW